MLQRDFLRARRTSSLHSPEPTTPTMSVHGRKSRPPSGRPLSVLTVNQGGGNGNGLCPGSSTSSFSTSAVGSPTGGLGDEKVLVAVRCRPPNPSQGEHPDDVVVSMDPSRGEIQLADHEKPWRVDMPVWSCKGAAADRSPPVTQASVYDMVGRPLLLHALEGYNSTLMAYGQTGSGKTYTMMGGDSAEEMGIIPRICSEMFQELQNRSFTTSSGETIGWEVHVRYVEVYCERISDLLNSGASVSIREEVTPQSATFALIGARRIKVEAQEDLLQVLTIGNKWRRTAATKSNDHSSRSHAIFMIELTELLSFEEPDGTVASAPSKNLTLRLVDLAGSERVGETGVQGQHLKEARDINLSLFTLGKVIECLSDPKRRHIKPPYRDSVLTKLLRDAFGGNSKTTMVCTIGPCERYRQQTAQTLNYAAKARRVLNKPRVEEDPSAVELRRANEELLALRRELNEAQRSGKHYEQIESQLSNANERLRREQLEARQRKDAMERREAELAQRLQKMEEQRDEYETHMAMLEAEAEMAKNQQAQREEELRRAHRAAEESAERRMRELQTHQLETEQTLRMKEEELMQRQRAVEAALREVEAQSQRRVESLLSRQRDLEAELRERERLAAEQEHDLRKKHKAAEETARQLELQSRAMEEEWISQVQSLEKGAQRREEDLALRAEEAQARLRAVQAEAQEKEDAMRCKWSEAEQQARQLQMEMDMKQAELDRRLRELSLAAKEREGALSTKLQQAEYELRCRERESARHLKEVEALRMAAAHQSETARMKERDFEAQHTLLTEGVRSREEYLRRREEELHKEAEEMVAMRQAWETQNAAKVQDLQSAHDAAVRDLKALEQRSQQREMEARQQQDDLNAKLRAKEMELKRREMELLAQRNDIDTQSQRERHSQLRAREEMQHALDTAEAENKLREERLQRWEDELRGRRETVDRAASDREKALADREARLAAAEDAIIAKSMEVEQLSTKVRMEKAAMVAQAEADERARERAHKDALAELERQQLEVLARQSSMQTMEEELQSRSRQYHSTSEGEGRKLEVAWRSLYQREMYNFIAVESLYRGSIISEEQSEYRFLFNASRMEVRDVTRRRTAAEHERKAQTAEEVQRRLTEERTAAYTQCSELKEQINDLRGELRERQEAVMQLKIQVGSATSVANRAEESLQAARTDAQAAEAQLREIIRTQELALHEAQVATEAATMRSTALAAGSTQLLHGMEERLRSAMSHHAIDKMLLMKLLEVSERTSADKDKAVSRWQSLCAQRGMPDPVAEKSAALRQRQLDEDVRRAATNKEEELKLREEGLVGEQSALQKRIVDFEARERMREESLRQQEEKIKLYLLELEEMDQKRVAAAREQENKLIEAGVRLMEKEQRLHEQVRAAQVELLVQSEEQQRRLCIHQHEIELDAMLRLSALTEERQLSIRGLEGDSLSIADLLRRQEKALIVEAEVLSHRMRQAEEEELLRQRRQTAEEEQIRQYLLALESEDIRRSELSQQGQKYLMEAEERLAHARKQEEALEDAARRLQVEAIEMEEKSRAMENELRRRERSNRKLMRERAATLDRQQQAADETVAANESALAAINSKLRETVQRNQDAEHAIRTRDAELKRQRMYYKDLSKMLEERDRMLHSEHSHRMDGKRSAVGLADDLLEANEALQRQLKTLARKYDVLRAEGRIECEMCSWLNAKDAERCRCCGNGILVG